MRLTAATRTSRLALWQTDRVGTLLGPHGVTVDALEVSTHGDRRTDLPLSEIGGKGVFVTEVQAAVLDGRARIAVHSAKDLPAATPDGLVLAGFVERDDPRDLLIGSTLADLPAGATVATGAARRQSQLAGMRPDLDFVGLRGNIETRLAKAADTPIVMAAAAIRRLGIDLELPSEVLDPERVVPQVGQGTIAVECRTDDAEAISLLERIEPPGLRARSLAERSFLAELGAGCDLPVAAHAGVPDESGRLELVGMIAGLDGSWRVDGAVTGSDPAAVGAELAQSLLARLTGEQRRGALG